MKTKTALVTFVAAFLVSSPILISFFGNDTSGEESFDNTVNINDRVAIIGGDGKISSKSINLSETFLTNDLNDVKKGDIIQIGKNTDISDPESFYGNLSYYLKSGNPMISFDGSDVFESAEFDMAKAFSENAVASAMFYNILTGKLACYSVECDDILDAEIQIYSWVQEMTRSAEFRIPMTSTSSTVPWGLEIASHGSKQCGEFGWFHVRTNYFKLETNNADRNYFKAGYILQSVPNGGGKSTSGMTITCDIDDKKVQQQLLDYGPTTTTGTSTAAVNLGFSVGTGGVSIMYNESWSYSISDAPALDQSDYGKNLFRIWHNVNEKGNVGSSTYTVKPGYVASSPVGQGPFDVTDDYTVQYCRKLPLVNNYWDHTNFTLKLNVYVPV